MDAGELRGRIAWLNTEGGFDYALNDDAIIEAATGVSSEKTDKILQELESKKDDIKTPTSWVSSALRKEKGQGHKRKASGGAAPMPMMSGGVDAEMQKVRKRINWLNGKGGFENSIQYEKVMEASGGLPFSQVLDKLKELEEKRDEVKDPNAWVCAALRKSGGGKGGSQPSPFPMAHSSPFPMAHPPAWQPPPQTWGAPPPGYGGGHPGGRQMDAEIDMKLRKRIRWLNENAGLSADLNYQKVSEAAVGLDYTKVMSVLKDVEEKKGDVRDPTAYVASAMRKSGGGGGRAGSNSPIGGGGDSGGFWMPAPAMPAWGAPPPSAWNTEAEAEDKKLRKRIGWLNKNGGLNGSPLMYDKILEAAGGLEFSEVFERLKQLETQKDTIKDPTAWVCTGLRRAGGQQSMAGPPMQMMSPSPYGMPFAGHGSFGASMDRDTESKLHKRIKWLNDKGGFSDALTFDKVKEAAQGVDPTSIMKVLKDLEEKKDTVKDPTAYVSSALRKLGGGKGGGNKGPRGMMGVKRTIGKVKTELI